MIAILSNIDRKFHKSKLYVILKSIVTSPLCECIQGVSFFVFFIYTTFCVLFMAATTLLHDWSFLIDFPTMGLIVLITGYGTIVVFFMYMCYLAYISTRKHIINEIEKYELHMVECQK